MAIDIDGFDALRAISSKPDLFADIRADVVKAARALLTKQLKAKGQTLARTKKIYEVLQRSQFSGILDGLKDTEIKALIKKIDKNNLAIADTADKNRKLLLALADGTCPPAEKASAAPKATRAPKKPPKQKATRAISSEAMAARWDGTNPDDPEK